MTNGSETAGLRCDLCGCEDVRPYATVFDVEVMEDRTRYPLLSCPGCGFVFLDPRSVRSDLDSYGDSYYSFRPLQPEEMRAMEAEARKADTPLRVLDVGCGAGRTVYRMQLEGHDSWGVEIDQRAVAAAREQGLNVVADLDEAPDGHFDLVNMSQVLEHTERPTGMIASVRRKLRDGGRLSVDVPNLDSVKFARILAVSKLVDVPRHRSFFNADTLRMLLERSGFAIEEVAWSDLNQFAFREFLGDLRRFSHLARKTPWTPFRLVAVGFNVICVRLEMIRCPEQNKEILRVAAKRT